MSNRNISYILSNPRGGRSPPIALPWIHLDSILTFPKEVLDIILSQCFLLERWRTFPMWGTLWGIVKRGIQGYLDVFVSSRFQITRSCGIVIVLWNFRDFPTLEVLQCWRDNFRWRLRCLFSSLKCICINLIWKRRLSTNRFHFKSLVYFRIGMTGSRRVEGIPGEHKQLDLNR